jgi:phosphoglycolate phosphatase-like HAD superfamily hydrolase
MDSDKKKLVIFDFDGVLVNTLEFSFDEHKKLNSTLTWKKFQDFSNGNFRIGMGKAVDEENYKIPDEWDDLYTKNIKDLTISDVLNKTIKELSTKYILTIVSSSSTVVINKFLEKEKSLEIFSDILGADIHANKTIKINSLLSKYNVTPANTVFITDSLGDILEANECGINSIGVTWGIHGKENLKKGNPFAIIDDPRELLSFINDVIK